MSPKTLECKLAQGQISRFLTGDRISDEAIRQLEAHVGECADCRELIAMRRRTLEQVVHSAQAVVQMEVEEAPEAMPDAPARSAKGSFLAGLRSRMVTKAAGSEGKRSLATPLVLSSSLALVLIAMSYVAKDPTRLLGPRLQPTPEAAPVAAKSGPKEAPKNPAMVSGTWKTDSTKIDTPKSEVPKVVPTKLAPTVSVAPPKRPVRLARSPRKWPSAPRPTRPTRGIRLYDESGSPLN